MKEGQYSDKSGKWNKCWREINSWEISGVNILLMVSDGNAFLEPDTSDTPDIPDAARPMEFS